MITKRKVRKGKPFNPAELRILLALDCFPLKEYTVHNIEAMVDSTGAFVRPTHIAVAVSKLTKKKYLVKTHKGSGPNDLSRWKRTEKD